MTLRTTVLAVALSLPVAACGKKEVHPSKPETVSIETKPEAKPEAKPEVKPEPTPEAKPDATPEAKPEPTPEAKPEVKPEVKPEPEAKPEPTTVAIPECDKFKLDKPLDYRDNSVKGDFRVMRLADGTFVENWKTVVVSRGADFAERWRLDDWGRWVAPSPDGKRLAVLAQGSQKVGIADAASGKIEKEAERTSWSSYVVWTADGKSLVVDNDKHLEVLDLDLKVVRQSPDLPDSDPYVGFLYPGPGTAEVLVISPNAGRIHRFDAASATFSKSYELPQYTNPEELVAGADGALFLTGDHTLHRLSDSFGLDVTRADFGCGGVIAPAKDAAAGETSEYHWHTVAATAADGRIATNDASGQLYVFEPKGLEALAIVPRDVVDQVEAMTWIDAKTLATLTNDGRFVVVDLDQKKAVATQKDL